MASEEKQLMGIIATSLLLLLVNVGHISCDFYTSVVGLEYLLDSEQYLVETYENYLKQVERTNHRIKDFLDQTEKTVKMIEEDPEGYYGDPLNAFKTLKRIVVDWRRMEQIVRFDRDGEDFSANFTEMTSLDYVNATLDDLKGASEGLARLQKTYALKSIDISDGILMDNEYDSTLSANDCFELGRQLYNAKNYNYSTEWLLTARILLNLEIEESEYEVKDQKMTVDFPHISDTEILEFLAPSMHNMGNYKMAVILNEELLAQDPTNEYGLGNKQLFESKVREERRVVAEVNTPSPASSKISEVDELTEAVCRGSLHQTPAEQRNLRCRYANNGVPFCLIAPFKMEELSEDPFVAVYYDTIYESEMKQIINATEDEIERSKVGDYENSIFSEIRTSKNSWLSYEENSFLNAIKIRLQHIIGLNLNYAEPLQVVNYGIGGHYGAHYDFSEEPDETYPGDGNRLLTALFYINEVELGGATAFPFLHLAVPPIKGSLVAWYNMHESLELDYRTKHAGCPVLKGSKWVCNEWFHQVGQEFIRPCSLERNGEISLPFKDLQ